MEYFNIENRKKELINQGISENMALYIADKEKEYHKRNDLEKPEYKTLWKVNAYNSAGFRERYAMINGNATKIFINGELCYKFTYNKYDSYQDANGATYNTVRKCWVD